MNIIRVQAQLLKQLGKINNNIYIKHYMNYDLLSPNHKTF